MSQEYFSLRELAMQFGVSKQTVRRWWKSGELEATPLGGHTVRFSEKAVQEFMAKKAGK